MRVLVLDDMTVRQVCFRMTYGEDNVKSTKTYNEFLNALDSEKWDIIHLDHDLGDFVENPDTYIDGWGITREFNGLHAAYKVCELPENKRPCSVIVHSINPEGAKAMVAVLTNGGLKAIWEPFGDCAPSDTLK